VRGDNKGETQSFPSGLGEIGGRVTGTDHLGFLFRYKPNLPWPSEKVWADPFIKKK